MYAAITYRYTGRSFSRHERHAGGYEHHPEWRHSRAERRNSNAGGSEQYGPDPAAAGAHDASAEGG